MSFFVDLYSWAIKSAPECNKFWHKGGMISNGYNRGKLGGALAVMPVFATIFGAVVSGILIEKLDFFAFFGLMGGIVAVVGIVSLFTLKDSPALIPKKDEKGFWRRQC